MLASLLYLGMLAFMLMSAMWVIVDCRRRGRPWGETLAWGLFAGWFFGLGLALYIYWKKKFSS